MQHHIPRPQGTAVCEHCGDYVQDSELKPTKDKTTGQLKNMCIHCRTYTPESFNVTEPAIDELFFIETFHPKLWTRHE